MDAEKFGGLGQPIHREPHVRGLGYNQYGDEADEDDFDRERFEALAEEWENETVLLSSSEQAAQHPAYQEILRMGEAALPLILERMQSHDGHWLNALHDITGADPVNPSDYGDIAAMEASWLEWGKLNGFA